MPAVWPHPAVPFTGFSNLKVVVPMRRILTAALLTVALISATADEPEEMSRQIKATIKMFKKADPEIEQFFTESKGYAVFPRIKKGGFGLGGAHGNGQLFEGGKTTGSTKVTQVTVGLQFGGQIYGEVIFFESEDSLKQFKEERLELSAQVSAVAASEGASKNAKYEHGVLIFTLAKTGLMYEASVGGQKFRYEPFDSDEE
jgi:lipid-binding SYLF domain-containing protein